MEVVTLTSDEGVTLAARWYGGEKPKGAVPIGGGKLNGAVLIGGAMGVRQDYYQRFAEWLAAQGYAVMTFDYRGMGESRTGAHRRSLRRTV